MNMGKGKLRDGPHISAGNMGPVPQFPRNPRLIFWSGGDADESAGVALVFEIHNTGDLGEQRVVFADADIQTRLELRASLPDKNRAAADELAAEALHAQSLRIAVASVSGTADALFMSHK